jgi:protein rogdi
VLKIKSPTCPRSYLFICLFYFSIFQQQEFEWILQKEVLLVLKQLHDILVECAHRFPVPLHGNEGKKVDKFVLTSAPEQLKVVVTLTGDSITHAVSCM